MADRERFERLFREHYAAVAAFCLRRLDDEDGADVVADVFATTWDRLDDVDETQARAWLYAVARNKVAHRWRANARRSNATQTLATQPNNRKSTDPAELVAEMDLVGSAANSLSPSDLELLQLVSWEGLGPDELAVVLGCTPGAAKVRVHRLRGRLQKRIDHMQLEPSNGNRMEQGLPHNPQMEER